MTVKLLTDHHLEFLGCTGLSMSTLVEMPHCWKSHVKAHMLLLPSSATHAPTFPDQDPAEHTRIPAPVNL